MHLKRFEGADMADVLRQVRETLGPDALVVSQRTVRRGRAVFGRLAGPVVEVTAAVERTPDHDRPTDPASRVTPDASWTDLRLARALVGPMETELQSLRRAVDRLAGQSHACTTGLLTEEIATLRRVARSLDGDRSTTPGGPTDALRALRQAGLDDAHAAELAAACGDGRPDEATLIESLAARLDGRLAPPRQDDAGAVLCVGPPGGGKTTTLAKLAARSTARDASPVLITTDVHRVGADASLRACARALDVPFEKAVSPRDLGQSLRRIGRRPVLVDTCGRSRSDRDALPELIRFRDALGERARVCVVLPANHKESDLRAEIDRYRPLMPNELVFTKLDESCDLGNVGNVLLDEGGPPLTWIANGQRVPEDLHLAEPGDLARRILGARA